MHTAHGYGQIHSRLGYVLGNGAMGTVEGWTMRDDYIGAVHMFGVVDWDEYCEMMMGWW